MISPARTLFRENLSAGYLQCKKIILLFCFGFIANAGFAQHVKGDNVVTFGTSLSNVNSYVPVNVMFDHAMTDKFSLGTGFNMNNNFYGKDKIMTRYDYGVRGLYHFGDFTNLDLYGGMRVGVEYWTSGRYANGVVAEPANTFPGFTNRAIKIGAIYPSAQAVLGVRYLWHNWMGITSEFAIGKPYMFSVGLSCNLNNTQSTFGEIKEKYNAELAPVDTKNIIKINLGTLIGVPGIAYERYLFNRFSLEAGASMQFRNSPLQLGDMASEEGLVSETDSLNQVIKAYGELKYYVTAKRQSIPKGWYTGIGYQHATSTTLVHVVDLRPIPGNIVYDYEKQNDQWAANVIIGYQSFIAKHFTLDIFGGVQRGGTKLHQLKYTDPNASEQNFIDSFSYHVISPRKQPGNIVFKISFGYRF